MGVVTLLFACVASQNLARVGAMDNQSRAGRHGRDPPEPDVSTLPNTYLDMAAWALHDHNHGTGIQHPVPGEPSRLQNQIIITRVVNGSLAKRDVLIGELVPNSNITSCNGPFGHAMAVLHDSEILYACLHPPRDQNRSAKRDETGGSPEFFAYIIRNGISPRSLIGVLTTGNARITLTSFLGTSAPQSTLRRGHVRYIKSDPIHPINTAGSIYTFVN